MILGSLLALLVFHELLAAEELKLRTRTSAGALRASIIYESGRADWAQYIASKLPAYMRAAEKYFKKPLGKPRRLIIEGCVGCQSRLENRHIYLDYDESRVSNPALLYHELTHLWLGYQWGPICQEWLMEGASSFAPLAMNAAGYLALSTRDKYEVRNNWGYYSDHASDVPDKALCPRGWKDKRLRYIKTFKLHKILYETLGHAKYRNFLRSLFNSRPRNNTAALRLLDAQKKASWKRILSGWVFGGRYRQISFDDFLTDGDADGLSTAEEALFHTSKVSPDTDGDLLPDGAEIALGLNPNRTDANASVEIEAHGPFIDGNDSEWTFFDYQSVLEPSGDSSVGDWADLISMKYLIRSDVLYLSVSSAAAPLAQGDIFFDTLIDTTADGQSDHEVAFWLKYPAWPWHYDDVLAQSELPWNLSAARGSTLEMAIPLSLLGAMPDTIHLLPIIRDDVAGLNFDAWDSWVSVPIP